MSDPKKSGPFVDLNGAPLIQNSVTAFLDILGFSQLCSLDTHIDESQEMLLRIYNAIREAVTVVEQSLRTVGTHSPA